jgi:hypothetical protein
MFVKWRAAWRRCGGGRYPFDCAQHDKVFGWSSAGTRFVSFAPTELADAGTGFPTACAVGCILSPLRGWHPSDIYAFQMASRLGPSDFYALQIFSRCESSVLTEPEIRSGGELDYGSERLGVGLFVVGGDGDHYGDLCAVGIGIDLH